MRQDIGYDYKYQDPWILHTVNPQEVQLHSSDPSVSS